MNLVLLTGEYPPEPGGVGDYTRRLAAAMRARDHSVAVLTIQRGALVGEADDGSPIAMARAGPALDWSHRVWPSLIAALDTLRPAWLHIQYQTGAYAMRPGVNLLPWRLRGLPGRPLVAVTFHDLLVPYLFPKAGPARAWVNRRLARDADAVVTTTTADAERLAALADLTPRAARRTPQVIPIGSNIPVAPPPGYGRAAWRAGLGVAPGELLVAYFGLLSPSKGAAILVEALGRLASPWRLLVVGGEATAPQDRAYAEVLRARLAAAGLADRVVVTGYVPDHTVSAHLLAADCVALPFRDGASFRRGSLLAALAHGRPVITTAPADPATTASLTGAALLVPPDDPGALAAALRRIVAAPDLARSLAAAGPRLAARFAWDTIAEQHERLYGGGPAA